MSPPVLGSYRLQPPSPFIINTQPESWYSFTIPRTVEGWVDLGTAGKVHTARAQGCKSQRLCDKHNCPQRDSIPGPSTLQSGMLPLDHCDLQIDRIHFLAGYCRSCLSVCYLLVGFFWVFAVFTRATLIVVLFSFVFCLLIVLCLVVGISVCVIAC